MNALVARLGAWPARARRCALAVAGAALLTTCATPEPEPQESPPATIADTTPSEQLPIDGIWQRVGSDGALVQIARGRVFVQTGFGAGHPYGELLYADVHQSGPTTYRCRRPVRDGGAIVHRACVLSLDDGLLTARAPGDADPDAERSESADRFAAVALADDVWYEAQRRAWYIVPAREAHRPAPEVAAIPHAPLPELPPSPPQEPPVLQTQSGRSRYGTYHALVIGTGDYEYLPAVATAVDDADAVSALLRDRYGFAVTNLRDPTRRQLLAAIDGYVRKLGERDNLLLYFAGRGFMSEELGRCYWFPVDATGDDPAEGLSNDDLAVKLRELRALRVLVVADSCFTASETRAAALSDAVNGARATVPRKRARVALSSGGLEPVQDGSGGAHSVFTGALLEALRANDADLDGASLSAEIRRIVTSGASESPEYGDIRGADHQGGDFVFVPEASLD